LIASNYGFSHRMVSSVLEARNDPQTIYAGLINDKEFGGVFVSHDGGQRWQQISKGIEKLDVLTLLQVGNGDVLAGTSRGIFRLGGGHAEWRPINVVVRESTGPAPMPVAAVPPRPGRSHAVAQNSELKTPVLQLEVTPDKWFAAAESGLFESLDEGKTWRGGAVLGYRDFRTVRAYGSTVLALTPKAVLVSADRGENWAVVQIPSYVTAVYGGAIAAGNVLWIATNQGALQSTNLGVSWEHTLGRLPARHISNVVYDDEGRRLLAISGSGELFASTDGGQSWQLQQTGFAVRTVTVTRGRLLAATAFDGVIIEPKFSDRPLPTAAH